MTMTDRYVGEILDVLDKNNMWDDTIVVLTTDHGFHMGEQGYMAKNYMAPYNEVFHIPLIISAPGISPNRSTAITQNIDVLPTVMEHFGVSEDSIPYEIHGKSLFPLLREETQSVRDDAIFGYFGKQVGYTDGRYTYFKAAQDSGNDPLYLYTAMPTILRQTLGCNDGIKVDDYKKIEMGRYLSWINYPVYRFPADIINFKNSSQEFVIRSENLLFDLDKDYNQQNKINDTELEKEIRQKLKSCLKRHDCPIEQYERLGME